MRPWCLTVLRSVGAVLVAPFDFVMVTTLTTLGEPGADVLTYTYDSPQVPRADANAHVERGPPRQRTPS